MEMIDEDFSSTDGVEKVLLCRGFNGIPSIFIMPCPAMDAEVAFTKLLTIIFTCSLRIGEGDWLTIG